MSMNVELTNFKVIIINEYKIQNPKLIMKDCTKNELLFKIEKNLV